MRHPQPSYTLFHGNLKVGTVIETRSDFLHIRGTITFDAQPMPVYVATKRLWRLIDLNRESCQPVDDEASQRALTVANANRELMRFSEYLRLGSWRLVDTRGVSRPIAGPIFMGSDGLAWGWHDEG